MKLLLSFSPSSTASSQTATTSTAWSSYSSLSPRSSSSSLSPTKDYSTSLFALPLLPGSASNITSTLIRQPTAYHHLPHPFLYQNPSRPPSKTYQTNSDLRLKPKPLNLRLPRLTTPAPINPPNPPTDLSPSPTPASPSFSSSSSKPPSSLPAISPPSPPSPSIPFTASFPSSPLFHKAPSSSSNSLSPSPSSAQTLASSTGGSASPRLHYSWWSWPSAMC